MLQFGASGYILKNVDGGDLIKYIEEALKGEIVLSPEIKNIITTSSHKKIPSITKREKQILSSIAEGETSQSIAEKLFISPLTVETHRRNLLQKFEAKNMAELIKLAMEWKMI